MRAGDREVQVLRFGNAAMKYTYDLTLFVQDRTAAAAVRDRR